MAGDWIKVEKATLAKPEVLAISELLGIHPAHAFGLCTKFWMWCDDQLENGNARGVTKVTLDFVIGHDGMTDALLKVDWLRDRSGSLEVPHFDRHLSEGAKNRALTKERVRKSKAKSNEPSVSKVTHQPLLEKRREEKREDTPKPPLEKSKTCETRRPTLSQATSAGQTIGITPEAVSIWWNKREASEWMKGTAGGGTTPVGSNWQADLTASKGWAEDEARKSKTATNGNTPKKFIPDS